MKNFHNKSHEEQLEIINDAYMNIDVNSQSLFNPLQWPPTYNKEPHLWISQVMADPNYFSFICKYVLNIDLLPFQALILREMWNSRFPMLIMSRGGGKSFLLSVYCVLRSLLLPGRRIVIAGAAFRQSKVVFSYIENIFDNAPLLRDIYQKPKKDILRHEPDMYRLVGSNGGYVAAIPIGPGGDKVRGLRANDLLSDEFNSIPRDIFETVLVGFTSVSSNPVKNVKEAAKDKLAKKLGIILDDYGESGERLSMPNQLVVTGTAGYTFQHFYDYWQDWHDIICSQGDKRKLERYLAKKKQESEESEENIVKNLNWRDYSIVRIPFELIPEGFMDQAQVARARATMHTGNYQTEYSACLTNQRSLILTDCGYKQYQNINIGDYVLSHTGQWQKVTKKTQREYNGLVYDIDTYGTNIPMSFTVDHPIWAIDEFHMLSDIDKNMYLPKLKLKSNTIDTIDISKYTNSSIIYDDYIYTAYPGTKISQLQIDQTIKKIKNNNGLSKTARELGISYGQVCNVKKNMFRRSKGSINRYIKLDYNFGVIIGYYAAEGSIGADGKQVGFAIGSHEPRYVNELCDAIQKVFDYDAKIYIKESVDNVTFNSRIVAEILSNICPGNCYNKFVDPKILYSNKEFMRGFLVGLFNGDACLYQDIKMTMHLSSLALISQARTCLLYFDIYSRFYFKPEKTHNNGLTNITNEHYRLDVDSQYFVHLMKVLYDINLHDRSGSKFCLNYDNYFSTRIKKVHKYLYSGLVYNLEVENDESYVLENGCVHNCFPADSNGFFKRSLIESCTVEPDKIKKNGQEILFYSTLYGDRSKRYVFGIDPASEVDNFAVVVLELLDDHARVVYCWTTNKKQHKEEVKNKFVEDHDYYMYCARKIRQLMQRFPAAQICIDSEGGGRTIEQIFQDKSRWNDDEPLILPIIDRDKPQDTDLKDGLHILEVCKFANAQWLAEANNTLRLSMETKTLLFPHFDALVLAQSEGQDIALGNEYDKLEYVVTEIEELKNELCTIVQTRTTTGRDRWDTPEVRIPGGKKGRMRKDRYSALIMANLAAHNLRLDTGFVVPHTVGGYAGHFGKQDGPLFWGNSEYASQLSQIYEHL